MEFNDGLADRVFALLAAGAEDVEDEAFEGTLENMSIRDFWRFVAPVAVFFSVVLVPSDSVVVTAVFSAVTATFSFATVFVEVSRSSRYTTVGFLSILTRWNTIFG